MDKEAGQKLRPGRTNAGAPLTRVGLETGGENPRDGGGLIMVGYIARNANRADERVAALSVSSELVSVWRGNPKIRWPHAAMRLQAIWSATRRSL